MSCKNTSLFHSFLFIDREFRVNYWKCSNFHPYRPIQSQTQYKNKHLHIATGNSIELITIFIHCLDIRCVRVSGPRAASKYLFINNIWKKACESTIRSTFDHNINNKSNTFDVCGWTSRRQSKAARWKQYFSILNKIKSTENRCLVKYPKYMSSSQNRINK